MSETVKDLARHYEKNVYLGKHPRNIGLFPIPEYPEYEPGRGMWSEALSAILTTLRYLAPATLLTLFWGQQSFLFKLLKHIDSAFRAIVFSSEEQKQSVLQWLAEAGPVRVEHLDTVWRHGWILCGVLDAALPGACVGHPPTRLSLKHAQSIADHYLGVEAVFSRQELESNDSLSKRQEWKLATYLDRIRQALAKLTPPVSKPTSQRTSPETTQFTLDYTARGSGLTAAQVNNKTYFKIYPTSQQSLDPGEITVLIRGPKDTYGMTVLPPVLGKAQLIRQKLLGLQAKPNFTENALPITQGATYLRAYGKNDMNKTYFIPKANYEIEIEEQMEEDYTKIGYIVNIEGKYEISITSRGQNIVGSPFTMIASRNIINILEKDNFCLEDGEEIDIVDVKTDRKVVLRIVDFVTEKMLLNENGSLEKISDEEARMLMSTDYSPHCNSKLNSRIFSSTLNSHENEFKGKSTKFNCVAHKVRTMTKVCKIFNDTRNEKELRKNKNENTAVKNNAFICSRSQQDIPDIVNSTFSDLNSNPFILSDKRDKFIIPENISVSLRTEKSKSILKEVIQDTAIKTSLNTQIESNTPDSLENYETDQCDEDILQSRSISSSNPFLNDMYEQNYVIEKDLGSFVKTEYEANNSQNEKTEDTSIKIMIEAATDSTPSPINRNPFIEPDIINLERPKTPVLKIITGEIKDRVDSVYVDPKKEHTAEEMLGNEFINLFFVHHHEANQDTERLHTTDFIIGAPVSLPPIIRAATPEPHMGSILTTNNANQDVYRAKEQEKESEANEVLPSVFSTPLHTNISKTKESCPPEKNTSSTFHSFDSNLTDSVEILSLSNASDNQTESYKIEASQSGLHITHRKDTWDSAYVSIDDSNNSPDSNNNDNTSFGETLCKQKCSPSEGDLIKMGPAEREIWQTCSDLIEPTTKLSEEEKPNKSEIKRQTFTPIIEEGDRSISSVIKDLKSSEIKQPESDAVTVAFAELNDMYHEYYPNSDSKKPVNIIKELIINKNLEYTIERNNICVDSASEISDVKRHAMEIEGKISEVQANVTESVSASQTLHDSKKEQSYQHNDQNEGETQFGDNTRTNIVLERKQYWDERIRQIEAKSEENMTQQKRKRLSSKHLRHNDSLTKRRGKEIVKKFLNAGEYSQTTTSNETTKAKTTEIITQEPKVITEKDQNDTKLVEKWKSYWNNKLETEKEEIETSCFRAKSPKNNDRLVFRQNVKQSNKDIIEVYKETQDNTVKSSSPAKQELPEEVFKAFETSPKRFFGTSRKQILNKIDTFLGKPSTADKSSADVSGATHETGLVSSRVSLFHTISQTEERPWARRKCQSMQNIFQRKDSEKSTTSVDEKLLISKTNSLARAESLKDKHLDNRDLTIQKEKSKNELKNELENISIKDKRARMVQKLNTQTFDETILCKKPLCEQTQTNKVKKTITEYNEQNQPHQKFKERSVLRKLSISKSEMDIFNKTTYKPSDDDLEKYKSCDELPKINVKTFISLYENVSKTVEKTTRVNCAGLQKNLPTSSSSGAVHENYSTRTLIADIPASKPSTYNEQNADLTQSISRNRWTNKSQDSASNGSYEPISIDSIDIEIVSNHDEKETTFMSLSDIELEIIENPDKSVESTPEKKETAHIDYKSRFKMAKQYFQSLEELREIKGRPTLNECELLLIDKSTESLENDRPQRRVKKYIKSHSMPSSEISKIWNELQESQSNSSTKLVKISEKFNVDDLFNDVMEGRLSRQGSLRGIPHKKAVLEAFRSMENLTDSKLSSYEIAVSQLSDFAQENHIKNAQTYLTEYPYLPTTDPSKYHSRLDAKATGLISLKELINQKPRRNSVPDLRINAKFTVDL